MIKGKVFVIEKRLWTDKDLLDIQDGIILVVKNTTPYISVVMDKIKAIVAEVDSLLCHAAIISREHNKPLLMGVKGATKNFKTGDEVVIDLESKTIRVC